MAGEKRLASLYILQSVWNRQTSWIKLQGIQEIYIRRIYKWLPCLWRETRDSVISSSHWMSNSVFVNSPLRCHRGSWRWCSGKDRSSPVHFKQPALDCLAASAGAGDITRLLPPETTKPLQRTCPQENKWNGLSRTDLCLQSGYCSLVSSNVSHISSFHPEMKA